MHVKTWELFFSAPLNYLGGPLQARVEVAAHTLRYPANSASPRRTQHLIQVRDGVMAKPLRKKGGWGWGGVSLGQDIGDVLRGVVSVLCKQRPLILAMLYVV